MHQPYANYPVYQPLSQNTSPSFYGSKDTTNEDLFPYQPTYVAPTPIAAKQLPGPKKTLPRKQTRNQYTKEQKHALEESYLTGAYVSTRRREEMAQELKLTAKQVKVWYQNRRQKEKRRDTKLKKQQPQPVPRAIKVPVSADSPDSGVQDMGEESHYQKIRQFIKNAEKEDEEQKQQQQQQQVIYQEPVTNKVDPGQQKSTLYYDDKYCSYIANSTATAASHYYSQYDFSQAFANYYNNYDYLQQYQYYNQLMSGYQSQQQQNHHQQYSAEPQEPQTYSGYWIKFNPGFTLSGQTVWLKKKEEDTGILAYREFCIIYI